jgi:outer membrane protein
MTCSGRARLLLLALGATLGAWPVVTRAQPAPPPTAGPQGPPAGTLAMPTPREALRPPEGIRPFPSPPEAIDRELALEEAVGIALVTQPQIRARLEDYAAAQQRVNQVLSTLLPQVTGFASATRSQSPDVQLEGAGGQRVTVTQLQSNVQTGISASQLIFDFGKTWAATDAAKASAQAFREQAEIQKDLTVLAVKEGYFNLLLSLRLVRVNEAALDRANLNLRSARGFFEVGTRPRSDVSRAEVDVANARVNLIRAQNAVSLSRTALNTAMGIAVNNPTRVRDILTYDEYRVDANTVVTEALRQRPETRQARAVVDQEEALVRQAFRNFFPDLVASGQYGIARPDIFSDFWSIGASLQWFIFDGGNRISRYKEEKIRWEAAKARLRDTELTVWREVEQAYLNLGAAEEQIFAARKAVESAEENFRLSQGRFDAGVGTIIELTDAQLELTQAQSQEAQALSDFRISIARLERAVGRR